MNMRINRLHAYINRINTIKTVIGYNILPTFMEYAYLLLTYLKTECRLYIAYIGTKGTKQKKGVNIAF